MPDCPTLQPAKPHLGPTMRTACLCLLAFLALGLTGLLQGRALAQPAGLNTQRDCQTIRTCNYARGGIYRGCLSSYSCRVCRFMAGPCRFDAGRRVCQELRCTWG
jgi:hypothetical protein